jgi:hypothetical protein
MQTNPPKIDPPKRKRRWFQFRLRTLMIFTLICRHYGTGAAVPLVAWRPMIAGGNSRL